MLHHQRGSGRQTVIITIVIAVILSALLYIVFRNPSNATPVNGTVSPQQDVQPSALAESQTEAESEAEEVPEGAQEDTLPETQLAEAQAAPESAEASDTEAQANSEQVSSEQTRENSSRESSEQTQEDNPSIAQTSPEQSQDGVVSETQANSKQSQESVETQANPESAQGEKPAAQEYTVNQGDTLASIARKHNTTVTALVEENAMSNPHQLSIGQVIRIPAQSELQNQVEKSNADQEEAPDRTYTVKPGDTLYSIARRYGTTVEAMTELNGLPDSAAIKSGQVLTLPSDALTIPK